MVKVLPEQQLKQLLAPLLTDAQNITLEPVRKGMANQVYHVRGEGISWAVKILGPAGFSAVDYRKIEQLQQQLANLQVAPTVVDVNLQHRVWVEQWVDTPSSGGIETDRLAQALAKIHNLDLQAPTLALLPCWQHYLEQLPSKQARQFIPQRDKLAAVIGQSSHYYDFCLCHNDLSFTHLVGDNRDIVIDWEYAATGNRYFDLAACALINELNETQCRALSDDYATRMGLERSLVYGKLQDFIPVVDFTNRLWQAAAERQC
ncbi:phosphotransferase [Alteromonas gilva]|uniref:Phosphotransferase n=1 Tax=Alteromonas gilva TaxID=2987522 RepID=A0ABT5L3P0_9ALTE|nr:phosphotransferase [Alteromonas gilva]MDC8831655.1 phosphotransferase [Alteromonas gilva]